MFTDFIFNLNRAASFSIETIFFVDSVFFSVVCVFAGRVVFAVGMIAIGCCATNFVGAWLLVVLCRFPLFFYYLVLDLQELGPLAFGVRCVFFWEGGLRFLMYTVVIFIFGCTEYIHHLVFIF